MAIEFDGTARAVGLIPAPPDRIYTLLANYHSEHPQILPREYFKKLEVLQGGIGAGTRTRLTMKVLGTTKTFEHLVTEPEPGRILVESDTDGSTVTTFMVESATGGSTTNLTITTQFRTTRRGLLGTLEKLLTVAMLHRIYRKELSLIAAYVQSKAGQS